MSQSVLCSPLTGSLTALGTEGQGWLKGAVPTAADLCTAEPAHELPMAQGMEDVTPPQHVNHTMAEWFGMGGTSKITYVLKQSRSTVGMLLVELAGGSCEQDRDCRGHISGFAAQIKIQQ